MAPRTAAAASAEPRPRVPLSRARVLRTAVAVADSGGIDALTMRRLAQELGVEAMSLYHHVANKEAVLDGVIEVVIGEILEAVDGAESPAPEDDWKGALRARILAARTVFLSHPWAPRVLESRTTMTPAVVGYFDRLLGTLRAGGFTYDLAHHAMHALGSRALGFTQELFEPDDPEAADAEATAMLEQMADRFPHIVGMMAEIAHDDPGGTLGWCDDQYEFEFGLDLILDGLEERRRRA
jgi:AcrR family transcriptional regulator